MISLPRTVKVWAYPAPCDLRKGYNGLYALVENEMSLDPLSGELFFVRQPPTKQLQGVAVGRHWALHLDEAARARSLCQALARWTRRGALVEPQ